MFLFQEDDVGRFHDAAQNSTELFFSGQGEFNDGQFTFQFRGQDHTAAQDDECFRFGFGYLEHVFELPDEDRVGVLEEQVEVPEEDDGLFREVLYGDQGFQRVVGGIVGAFLGVDQAIHHRPEDEVVFEFLGNLGDFQSDPLFFGGYEVKPWIAGSDVVDDFGSHCCIFPFVVLLMVLFAFRLQNGSLN